MLDVLRQDSRLVGLRNVSVDSVDSLNYAPILFRKPGISENRSHVSPILARIIGQVSERSLSEFHTIDSSLPTHKVAHMTCRRATSRPKIKNRIPGPDRDLGEPFQNGGS